jgi:hypothetical protein
MKLRVVGSKLPAYISFNRDTKSPVPDREIESFSLVCAPGKFGRYNSFVS